MSFEEHIKTMKEALVENPECGYAKDFIRHEELSDGRNVKIQLLIEIEYRDITDCLD